MTRKKVIANDSLNPNVQVYKTVIDKDVQKVSKPRMGLILDKLDAIVQGGYSRSCAELKPCFCVTVQERLALFGCFEAAECKVIVAILERVVFILAIIDKVRLRLRQGVRRVVKISTLSFGDSREWVRFFAVGENHRYLSMSYARNFGSDLVVVRAKIDLA